MLAALVTLLIGQGPIYSWVDQGGVEHFTDELASVPKGAKVRTTEGDAVSHIASDVTQHPAKPHAVETPEEAEPPGRAEEAWRRLFKDARARVEDLEADIEADRTRVEEVNGLPINAQLNCLSGWWGPVVTTGVVGGSFGVTGQLGASTVVTGSYGTTIVQRAPMPVLVNPCAFVLNPEFERARERLAKNRRELVRAKDDLADLERRASFAAVPLHWRR